ncbi:DUF3653 domain-containing protein [Lysobacter capsici]
MGLLTQTGSHRDYSRQDLTGPWQGWRFRGRDLISPNGTRMSPERLQGLAWREHSEARLIQVRSRNAATKAAKIGSR